MKLTQARYEAFARLGSEIDSRIDRACKLYNSLLKDSGISVKDETEWHNGTTWLDTLQCSLDLDWSVSWSYGGHDSGSNRIPMECLVDDTWEEEVTKRANETIAKYKAEEKTKATRKRKREHEEFNRLKAKFEGDES